MSRGYGSFLKSEIRCAQGLLRRRLHVVAAEKIQTKWAGSSFRGAGGNAASLRYIAERVIMFKRPLLLKGDVEVSPWNEWTFILFVVFLASTPSRKMGRHLQARSDETYFIYSSGIWALAGLERSPSQSKLQRAMQSSEDPIARSRRNRRGLRRRHIRRKWRCLEEVREASVSASNQR